MRIIHDHKPCTHQVPTPTPTMANASLSVAVACNRANSMIQAVAMLVRRLPAPLPMHIALTRRIRRPACHG